MENAIKLEAKTSEENIIKQYVENNATAILIDKINNGYELDGVKYNKDFGGFMKFACDMARKQSAEGARYACVDDKTVFGWAMHYFEEDTITDYAIKEGGEVKKPERHNESKIVSLKKPEEKKVKNKKIVGEQMSLFEEIGE